MCLCQQAVGKDCVCEKVSVYSLVFLWFHPLRRPHVLLLVLHGLYLCMQEPKYFISLCLKLREMLLVWSEAGWKQRVWPC